LRMFLWWVVWCLFFGIMCLVLLYVGYCLSSLWCGWGGDCGFVLVYICEGFGFRNLVCLGVPMMSSSSIYFLRAASLAVYQHGFQTFSTAAPFSARACRPSVRGHSDTEWELIWTRRSRRRPIPSPPGIRPVATTCRTIRAPSGKGHQERSFFQDFHGRGWGSN